MINDQKIFSAFFVPLRFKMGITNRKGAKKRKALMQYLIFSTFLCALCGSKTKMNEPRSGIVGVIECAIIPPARVKYAIIPLARVNYYSGCYPAACCASSAAIES